MSGGDYVTYGGITINTGDVKNFERIKIREYNHKEDIYVVTLNNGTKISSNNTAAPANAASKASVFLNDDKSVTLNNLLFVNVKGVDGQQDVFRVYGKETMRNTFNLGNVNNLEDNDKIIVGEEIPSDWFSKLNRVKLKSGDVVDFEANVNDLYISENIDK